MPNLSKQFMLNRAQKTCAVAAAISSSWEWTGLTVAQMNALRTAAEAQVDAVAAKAAATDLARGNLDDALDALYAKAVQGLGLARRHFSTIPGKGRIFEGIKASSNSREAKRQTIREFFKAWAQADTAWELNLPGGSYGFTTFQNSRKAIEGDDAATPPVPGLVDALAVAEQEERREAEKLNGMLTDMEAQMEAWYADATTVFAAGTPEGDQIRGQIPTTYDPNNEPLPIPPTPSNLAAQYAPDTQVVDAVCLPASFADEYIWTLTLPGHSPDVIQNGSSEPMIQFTDIPPVPQATLTVAAKNNTGISAASAPITVIP